MYNIIHLKPCEVIIFNGFKTQFQWILKISGATNNRDPLASAYLAYALRRHCKEVHKVKNYTIISPFLGFLMPTISQFVWIRENQNG